MMELGDAILNELDKLDKEQVIEVLIEALQSMSIYNGQSIDECVVDALHCCGHIKKED